jgi:hypothetical protein
MRSRRKIAWKWIYIFCFFHNGFFVGFSSQWARLKHTIMRHKRKYRMDG